MEWGKWVRFSIFCGCFFLELNCNVKKFTGIWAALFMLLNPLKGFSDDLILTHQVWYCLIDKQKPRFLKLGNLLSVNISNDIKYLKTTANLMIIVMSSSWTLKKLTHRYKKKICYWFGSRIVKKTLQVWLISTYE